MPENSLFNVQKATRKGQDAITIGIFTVLYLVILSIGAIGFLFGPVVFSITSVIATLINGITFMMFFSRVYSFSGVLYLGIVTAIYMSGHGWPAFVIIVILSLIVTALLYRSHEKKSTQVPLARRRSPLLLMFSYALFSLWYVGPILPVYLWQQSKKTELIQFYSLSSIIMIEIAMFIAALIGSWIGLKVRHKHFEPAGVA